MIRSLYSGVSGIRNHQTRMDVIGNNIANVNTVAYKASRVTFQDVFSQTIRSATENTGQMGGRNAVQVGLGMQVGSIDTLHTRTAVQRTDYPLDLSIQGDGFFVVGNNADELFYTRAGNFNFDNDGYLVDANGYYVKDINGDSIEIDLDLYSDIFINELGEIKGIQNGQTTHETIKTIRIATFNNNSGLAKAGNNLYQVTQNSGSAQDTQAGQGGAGLLAPGTLEMSNVDLTQEFTDMIVTQRGFQANSRVITTSDSLLEEILSLKR